MAERTDMTKVETKGLLFDMDGVLVSSIGSVNRCWLRWCREYAIPDAENFQVPHGTRARDIIRQLRPDLNEAEVDAALVRIEDIEIEDVADLKVLPGAAELLAALPEERWAIVTSATRRLLFARLQVAGLPVPRRIISGEMVVHGKPDAEPYLRGAALLGFAPEECVVVEDAPSGVAAGVAAGCRVLGVLGTHRAEELTACTWLIDSLAGVDFQAGPVGLTLQWTEARR